MLDDQVPELFLAEALEVDGLAGQDLLVVLLRLREIEVVQVHVHASVDSPDVQAQLLVRLREVLSIGHAQMQAADLAAVLRHLQLLHHILGKRLDPRRVKLRPRVVDESGHDLRLEVLPEVEDDAKPLANEVHVVREVDPVLHQRVVGVVDLDIDELVRLRVHDLLLRLDGQFKLRHQDAVLGALDQRVLADEPLSGAPVPVVGVLGPVHGIPHAVHRLIVLTHGQLL
mmetsp:Transcript_6593/g.15032  ORF Transcript_6593/g.15032 Transcript_6593/m.15032 type:complete len:228 (-) Transcript_6593:478-1161(-)